MDETNEENLARTLRGITCNVDDNQKPKVKVGDNVFKDIALDDWLVSFAHTHGGKKRLRDILHTPTWDTECLVSRAECALKKTTPKQKEQIARLRELEPTVIWFLGISSNIKQNWPLPMLFPTWPLLNRLNNVHVYLLLFHIFRGYISPFLNIVYPLSSVFGPYFYLRRSLGWKIPLMTYLNIIKVGIIAMMKPSNNVKANVSKYVTLIIYVVLFLYTLIQGFDVAHMIRAMRRTLLDKMARLCEFVQISNQLIYDTPLLTMYAYGNIIGTKTNLVVEPNLASFYSLLTNPDKREHLISNLNKVYAVDAACAIHDVVRQKGWGVAKFADTPTVLWNMGHPLLSTDQRRNPIDFSKNIIITGPNAAGKTTYMKAVCANIILAHTFGIVYASKNTVSPVHAIGSFIRVHDTVGHESLFEAELRRCAAFVKEAEQLAANGGRAIYFLDEPMHSTPPIEGAATAMAVAQYMGRMPHIRTFVTTHYHQVTMLEKMEPSRWINISMESQSTVDGFVFPYKIRKGPSFQCIALELLKDHGLPDTLVQTAIEMKNKLCGEVLDNDS
jgi:hypothetical protein